MVRDRDSKTEDSRTETRTGTGQGQDRDRDRIQTGSHREGIRQGTRCRDQGDKAEDSRDRDSTAAICPLYIEGFRLFVLFLLYIDKDRPHHEAGEDKKQHDRDSI